MPDRIEAGTLLCAVAGSGGKLTLKRVEPEHLVPVLHKLEECGCVLDIKKDTIKLEAPKKLNNIEIKTMPYPGFPTDMQSVFAGMLSTAKGTSIISENIFENRYKYVNELRKMGAKITIEGKICVIKGTRKLYGAKVSATDLRGGASLIIAGVNAKRKNWDRRSKICVKRIWRIRQKTKFIRSKNNIKKRIEKMQKAWTKKRFVPML